MERTIKLSKRLSAISSYIENNSSVIDVGTDHGYIPVWLAQTGRAEKIYASDLRKGPLDSARRTAAEYGVTDKIEFILTDGLVDTDLCSYDTVVIAGMGGETIISILENSKWVIREGMKLILQPQSKVPELLKWLNTNKICVDNAQLVEDEHRIYVVLSTKVGRKSLENDFVEYFPSKLIDNKDPLLYSYLSELEMKIKKTVLGLQKSERADNYLHSKILEFELERINSIKKEAFKWQR